MVLFVNIPRIAFGCMEQKSDPKTLDKLVYVWKVTLIIGVATIVLSAILVQVSISNGIVTNLSCPTGLNSCAVGAGISSVISGLIWAGITQCFINGMWTASHDAKKKADKKDSSDNESKGQMPHNN